MSYDHLFFHWVVASGDYLPEDLQKAGLYPEGLPAKMRAPAGINFGWDSDY